MTHFSGDWSALSGISGGPIYANITNFGYVIVGILVSGSSDNGSYNNGEHYSTALKISNNLYKLILSEI